MKVYLCGGINGLSDSAAKDWREEAKDKLKHETLDPMVRDYRGRENEMWDEIVTKDVEDINNSDALLVNASRPSWGTAMEIIHAFIEKKVIVAFGVAELAKASPWLRYHCNHIVPSFDEAVEILNSL